MLSFIDSERQWKKAAIGIEIKEFPRFLIPCNETLYRRYGYYEIVDVEQIPKSEESHHIKYLNENGFRSYVGVPIHSRDNFLLGTLYFLYTRPTQLKAQNRNPETDLT